MTAFMPLLNLLEAVPDPRRAEGKVYRLPHVLDGLKNALAEQVLYAELGHHLDGGELDGRPNGWNGYGKKTVLTGSGWLELQIPRDRLANFDPLLIAKYQRRLPGFDKTIVPMDARHEHPRDPGVSAGDLRPRDLARPWSAR